jgi:hypothetical protein
MLLGPRPAKKEKEFGFYVEGGGNKKFGGIDLHCRSGSGSKVREDRIYEICEGRHPGFVPAVSSLGQIISIELEEPTDSQR